MQLWTLSFQGVCGEVLSRDILPEMCMVTLLVLTRHPVTSKGKNRGSTAKDKETGGMGTGRDVQSILGG